MWLATGAGVGVFNETIMSIVKHRREEHNPDKLVATGEPTLGDRTSRKTPAERSLGVCLHVVQGVCCEN